MKFELDEEIEVSQERYNQLREVLESFLESADFADAVIAATRADLVGSRVEVEIYPDGKWATVDMNFCGNGYEPPGAMLALPIYAHPFQEDQEADEEIKDEAVRCCLEDDPDAKPEMRQRLKDYFFIPR